MACVAGAHNDSMVVDIRHYDITVGNFKIGVVSYDILER